MLVEENLKESDRNSSTYVIKIRLGRRVGNVL